MSEIIKKMIRSKFDKEIEIPNISLENINKALKEMGRITNEMINPFDSVLDKMVKDIRDRQDNVIAMEFTKCIGELLKKNGVVPKMTEYTRNFETDNTFETRYGVSIDELDFTEHDKVFEDKYKVLKEEYDKKCKDYKSVSGLLSTYQQENETLKERIIELENFSCQAEQETESLVEKLKQRIAELERKNNQLTESILRQGTKIHELESKGTEKPTKVNLNDRIKVKLTPLGAEIYYHQYDEVNKRIKENGGTELEPIMPRIDKDGYTGFQLWHFMELYGEYIGVCKPNVITPLDIIIVE